MSAPACRLELVAITKRFGALVANQNINLQIRPGEIHAILGENGAGKSTLMKIIYGALAADSGEIRWNGQTVHISHPQIARKLGIAMVFQHFSLFENLTVLENIALALPGRKADDSLAQEIQQTAQDYGLELDTQRPVYSLSVGERQRVEIIRALLTQPQLLILDEPTAVLSPAAVQSLFASLRKIAAKGCSILLISHKLDEVRDLCERATVLRQGQVVAVCQPQQLSLQELAHLMIGQDGGWTERRLQQDLGALAEVRLKLQNFSLPAQHFHGVNLQDLDLELYAGEILGIAGVSGNGQHELFELLSGEQLPNRSRGQLQLIGRDAVALDVSQRRTLGLRCVPEQRLGRASVAEFSLADNLLISRQEPGLVQAGWIKAKALHQAARQILHEFAVKSAGSQASAASLSGGNLQKFILGRELQTQPQVLVLAQPTWGVDIASTQQIWLRLHELKRAGCAILLITEDLDELFELADRIQVMAKGRLSPSVNKATANPEILGNWMSGLWDDYAEAETVALRGLRKVRQAEAVYGET